MENVKIRKAKKEDLKYIKEIFSTGIVEESKIQYPKMPRKEIMESLDEINKIFKNFKKELNSKNYLWIIAEEKNKVIGFSSASIKDKKFGKLNMNYVTKEYRRKGIGKNFVEKRIKWLKKRGIKKIYANAFIKNKASNKNLNKFGFQPVSFNLEKIIK